MFSESDSTESTLLSGIAILQTLLMTTKFKLVSLFQYKLIIYLKINVLFLFCRGEDSNEIYNKKQSLAEILCITILPFLEHIHNVLLFPPKVSNCIIIINSYSFKR